MGVIDRVESKVLVYGDIHLSSKNYGAHKDYAKESLEMFSNITRVAKELGVTHIIGLGDFSYGRFNTLEYRVLVEKELNEQNMITNGNRYELKGNHDTASYGMTEYEYYIEKGLLKPATNLILGNANISMVNFGEYRKHDIIAPEIGKRNIVCMHDYFRFKDTQMPDYGQAIYLDEFEPWYGVDSIIGGHIHSYSQFTGSIANMSIHRSHNVVVTYLGCPCRPSYIKGNIQDYGVYEIIKIGLDSNGEQQVEEELYTFKLWDETESFNIVKKEEAEAIQALKRVDVSDIVKRLDNHERVSGDPEQAIYSMPVKDEYKNKAIEFLRLAMS